MSSESGENCAVCGIASTLKCTACKTVAYCGKDHQKQHWKNHKNACRPFEIKTDEKLGRYLEASRDIQERTTITSESPIIVGPKWSEENVQYPVFNCVGCFEEIKVLNCKCPICFWPACRPECIGLVNPQLHDIECGILSIGRGPANRTDLKSIREYYRPDALLALKCLMLQVKNPKKWKQLMELEAHEKDRKSTFNYEEAEKSIKYLEDNYLSLVKLAEEKSGKVSLPLKDKKTLHKIYGIIETNAMYINLVTGNEIAGIYPTGCLLEHSCVPNCFYTFDMKDGFKLIIKAGRAIKKGEHLSTMYSHLLWGTQLRLQHLKDAKYFNCTCFRCSDKTEMGTYFSAMRCFGTEEADCNGIHLPENPLSFETEWACDKCLVKVANEQVMFLTGRMGEDIDRVLAGNPSISELEAVIDKLAPFLHQNHYHMFTLKHTLIQLYDEKVSDEILKKKLKMCEELLAIVDALDPHSIRVPIYTGIILYEKHSVLLEMHRRKQESDLSLALKCLERARDILIFELDIPQAKTLHEQVVNDISHLEREILGKQLSNTKI